MKSFKTREEAFASQNYDPDKVVITGVPEHHVEALKAAANLFVVHDAVNEDEALDWTDGKWKYSNYFKMGSRSGAGFSFFACAYWASVSVVGSRLSSGTSKASELIAKICKVDYKKFMVYDRKTKK